MHSKDHSITIYNTHGMGTRQVLTSRQVASEDVPYATCDGLSHHHSGIIKAWNTVICSSIDEPREYYAQWSQAKTNTIWCHLHIASKTNTNESIHKTETDSQAESKFMVTKGNSVGRERSRVWD